MNEILYLCAGERFNPIIETQVIRLLRIMGEQNSQKRIHLLLLPNVSLRHPLDSFCGLRRTASDVKKRLDRVKVTADVYPLIYPLRSKHFYMKVHHLAIFFLQAFPIFLYSLIRRNPTIIHARSYPACVLAFWVSRLFRIPYVFDMRGLYPEEGIFRGVFSENSIHYKMWKSLEKKMIKEAKCVVVLSYSVQDIVKNICQSARVSVIPCCVDINLFCQGRKRRQEFRRKHSLSDKFVLVYCGSMGWNDPKLLAEYFLRFRAIKKNGHLLILTFKRYNATLEKVLRSSGISSDLYTILNPPVEDVPNLLPMGDVGLLFVKNHSAAQKVVSIKFAEYLASGLPVVVSYHGEGVAQLVKMYGCGIIVDPENGSLKREKWLLENYSKLQRNSLKLAVSYLAVDKCAKRYLNIYES